MQMNTPLQPLWDARPAFWLIGQRCISVCIPHVQTRRPVWQGDQLLCSPLAQVRVPFVLLFGPPVRITCAACNRCCRIARPALHLLACGFRHALQACHAELTVLCDCWTQSPLPADRELSVDTTPVPGNPLASSPSQPTTPAQSTVWHPAQEDTQSRWPCGCRRILFSLALSCMESIM